MPYCAKIIDIIDETKEVKTYLLEKPEGFSWDIGSHTLFGLDYLDGSEIKEYSMFRYMSVMTLPTENVVGFTTKIPGSNSQFKKKLTKLKIGDEIGLFRVGSILNLRREKKPIILLSMGVGIATMRPLIYTYLKDKTDIPSILNLNVNSSKEYVYQEELDDKIEDNYCNLWVHNRIEFFSKLDEVIERQDAIYYIVGSDDFMKHLIMHLKEKGVSREQIVIDRLPEFAVSYYGL